LCNLINKGQYTVVVTTEGTFLDNLSTNKVCRDKNAKFIATNVFGGFGNIFCDFGKEFIVRDTDGEESKTGVVLNLEPDTNGQLTVICAEPHNLSSGDIIKI